MRVRSRTYFRLALAEAQSRLPSDMELRPLYDRAELVDVVIGTVGHNLVLAGGLVLAVLLLFLRSWRAALIVTIPAGPVVCPVSWRHGDFRPHGHPADARGHGFWRGGGRYHRHGGERRPKIGRYLRPGTSDGKTSRLATIIEACCQVRKPMLVGMLVIIGAYVPILTLGGVEGRMFRPLAQSVIMLLLSSLLLTLTLVPALCALGLASGPAMEEPQFCSSCVRLMDDSSWPAAAFGGGFWPWRCCWQAEPVCLSTRLGANFLPYLDEGWLVVEVQRDPQISLAKSLDMELQTERAIRAAVPEVKDLFSRIGMSEIATDPQGANQNDIYLSFRPRADGAKSTASGSPNPSWRKSSSP